jgi:hypothetical protein
MGFKIGFFRSKCPFVSAEILTTQCPSILSTKAVRMPPGEAYDDCTDILVSQVNSQDFHQNPVNKKMRRYVLFLGAF